MNARVLRGLVRLSLLFWGCSCGAQRVAPESEGTSVAPGPCGRGLVVLESDYQSSNVSLLAFDGTVLSPSFASSSTENAGFSLTLGDDAVPPFSAMTGSNLVLIDRTPKGVLHFVDLASARVTSELVVGTGFSANPHDYLELQPNKAYVPRYDSNPNPGEQPFDGGGDILIVDPSVPAITGRIELAPALSGEAANFTPNPSRVVQANGRIFVLLASYAMDYTSATTSRIVELDPNADSILSTTLLDGLKGCDSLALAPDQSELAVACTGGDTLSDTPSIAAAGIALVDLGAEPKLTKTFPAAIFGQNPIGFGIAYFGQNQLLFDTLGHLGANPVQDSLVNLDTSNGDFGLILESQTQPFTLGDVRCAPACNACFVADAERAGGSVLRLVSDEAGALGAPNPIRAETQIGLPPRYLGAF
ncbi:MAG TPA: hypothetical protein VHV51_01205 [Polyangiaceae bacterium]|jgi:hypothetical protein|nr:hypothetical protein [Polyangiaceae bacterium]